MVSKTCEELGQSCLPVYHKKEKKNYTAWKSEIMSLLVDFSLKKLILSKKTQTNKKHTKTPKTAAFIFTEVIYCFSS